MCEPRLAAADTAVVAADDTTPAAIAITDRGDFSASFHGRMFRAAAVAGATFPPAGATLAQVTVGDIFELLDGADLADTGAALLLGDSRAPG